MQQVIIKGCVGSFIHVVHMFYFNIIDSNVIGIGKMFGNYLIIRLPKQC